MAITKITGASIAADSIDGTKIADDAINSEHITDGGIDNVHLADDAVAVAELSATGTASNTTFLRGDNSWQTAGSTSASDLTSGTLPIARIADGAVTAAKVAADVATQAELDTVSTVASAALPKAGGTMTGVVTFDNDGAVSYNGATDLDGESFIKLEGTSADGEAAMIRWANHGSMNNYFGVVQVGASGQGDFVWTSYDGSAYAERMRISSAGRVTMPSQPAFRWTGCSGTSCNTPAVNTSATFTWGSEDFDIGNNATSTRFTAPVAGTYHFDIRITHGGPSANTETRYMALSFWKNGAGQDSHSSLQAYEAVTDGWGSGNSYHVQNISTNIQLAANDYVELRLGRSSSSDWNGTVNNDRSAWSGFLIG